MLSSGSGDEDSPSTVRSFSSSSALAALEDMGFILLKFCSSQPSSFLAVSSWTDPSVHVFSKI